MVSCFAEPAVRVLSPVAGGWAVWGNKVTLYCSDILTSCLMDWYRIYTWKLSLSSVPVWTLHSAQIRLLVAGSESERWERERRVFWILATKWWRLTTTDRWWEKLERKKRNCCGITIIVEQWVVSESNRRLLLYCLTVGSHQFPRLKPPAALYFDKTTNCLRNFLSSTSFSSSQSRAL